MAKNPEQVQTHDQYEPSEAQRRFEAALRGSRKVGHKPMKSMTPKKPRAPEKANAKVRKTRSGHEQ